MTSYLDGGHGCICVWRGVVWDLQELPAHSPRCASSADLASVPRGPAPIRSSAAGGDFAADFPQGTDGPPSPGSPAEGEVCSDGAGAVVPHRGWVGGSKGCVCVCACLFPNRPLRPSQTTTFISTSFHRAPPPTVSSLTGVLAWGGGPASVCSLQCRRGPPASVLAHDCVSQTVCAGTGYPAGRGHSGVQGACRAVQCSAVQCRVIGCVRHPAATRKTGMRACTIDFAPGSVCVGCACGVACPRPSVGD